MSLRESSLNSMYVGAPQHPDGRKSGRATTPSSGYGRVPSEVRYDKRLTHRDVHVYVELAAAERGGIVTIGERLLAELARVDRRSLREVIGRLVEFGHVGVEVRNARARAYYRLTSPLFTGKITEPGGGKEPEVSANPQGATEKKASRPAVKMCPECHKLRHGRMAVGWCRTCNTRKNTEKLVRRVLKEEMTQKEKTA